jgi:hypothetical protein
MIFLAYWLMIFWLIDWWLAGLLIDDLLSGWMIDWLSRLAEDNKDWWLAGLLMICGLLIELLGDWLICWVIDWFVGLLSDLLVYWWIDLLAYWLSCWLIDWLISWFIDDLLAYWLIDWPGWQRTTRTEWWRRRCSSFSGVWRTVRTSPLRLWTRFESSARTVPVLYSTEFLLKKLIVELTQIFFVLENAEHCKNFFIYMFEVKIYSKNLAFLHFWCTVQLELPSWLVIDAV